VITSGLHPHPTADAGPGQAADPAPLDGAAAPASRGLVALEGRLDEFTLEELLTFVSTSGRSGVLELEGPRSVVLYFAGGDLCGGESLDTPIPRTTLRARVAQGAGEDRALVEDHLLTALAAARVSIDALVRFRPGPADPELSRFRFPLQHTLDDAQRRVEEWRIIADVLPSTDVVLQMATDLPDNVEEVAIARGDWQVLCRVDGQSTVTELIGRSGRSAFDVCSALYRLILSGVITAP